MLARLLTTLRLSLPLLAASLGLIVGSHQTLRSTRSLRG